MPTKTVLKPNTGGTKNKNGTTVEPVYSGHADMLYSGHLIIADRFSRNGPNHGQTLIEIPLYSGQFYSGHLL